MHIPNDDELEDYRIATLIERGDVEDPDEIEYEAEVEEMDDLDMSCNDCGRTPVLCQCDRYTS